MAPRRMSQSYSRGKTIIIAAAAAICSIRNLSFMGIASPPEDKTKPTGGASNTEVQRPPWDVFRALRTASFYGALPNPLNFFSQDDAVGIEVGPGETLWSPQNPRQLVWGVLDDVVMGGASESFFEGNVWQGTIITEGGGFAGIRTQPIKPAFDLSRCNGIRLRVRGGNDQRFKLIIRDSYEWNGVAWSYEFDTKVLFPFSDGTVEVSAPFTDFVPTIFAKRIPNVKFNAGQLTALQVTLSRFGYDGDLNPNFKPGSFSMTIQSIETY